MWPYMSPIVSPSTPFTRYAKNTNSHLIANWIIHPNDQGRWCLNQPDPLQYLQPDICRPIDPSEFAGF